MTSDLYVCRCACGSAFASLYPSTRLCPACCPALIEAGEQSLPNDFAALPAVEDPFSNTSFSMCAETRLFFGDVLGSFSPRAMPCGSSGQCGVDWETLLTLLLIIASVMGIGYGASMGLAWLQGWDR